MDHCSKFMYFYNQVKCSFESTLRSFGFTVLNYHGDNGIFVSQAFKDDCHTKGKQISFSVYSLTQTLWDQLISTVTNLKHLTLLSNDTWLGSEQSILRENLGPKLNDSDQTNEIDEGERSEDDSGNSPSPEAAPE